MKTVKTLADELGARMHLAKLPVIGKGAVLSLAVAMGPAAADDTEVFFGQVDPNADIHPNVLFVLDTSGSMNWGDDGQEGSRLERLKEAMTTIIDSSTNLNMGLMRFNGLGGGGSVIYPVKALDEEICAGAACGEVSVARRVLKNEDDAEQKITDKNVSIDGNILSMSYTDNDDNVNKQQHVGLRFRDLKIPQGATIKSAKVVFTADRTSDNDDGSLQIFAEDRDNADVFKTDKENISNRTLTSAQRNWNPLKWLNNRTYDTPDISSVIQEVVDRNGWCGGNALALVIKGDAFRDAKSRNQSANKAPLLRVTYDASGIPPTGGCIKKTTTVQISSGSDDAQERINYSNRMYTYLSYLYLPRIPGSTNDKMVTGLRFKGLGIPRNATILNARLELNAAIGRSGDTVVNVDIENNSNSETFKDVTGNITARTKVGNPIEWTLPGDADAGEKFKSNKNLKALVQAVVNRPDWSDNNPMTFFISHKSGSGGQYYKTYERESPNAPKLRVTYRTTGATGSAGTNILVRDQLKEVINNLTATGGTPIVSAYAEAAQYMLGGGVDYGRSRGTKDYPGYGDRRHKYHRVSDPSSYTLGAGGNVVRESLCKDSDPDADACRTEEIVGSAVYDSPLGDTCQSNHIVFLSDGAPTSNNAAGKVRALTGVDSCEVSSGNEACGIELGEWLNETDHIPNIKGTQGIATYTIGFNQNSAFLEAIAKAGGGKYNQADSADQLVATFQSILSEVAAVDTSFVAPGATVNQFNRLTHRSDIYFALFQPNKRPSWNGNLKRYEVRPSVSGPEGEVTIQIQGQDGNDAIDASTGFFADNSWSLWSGERDGSAVANGGSADELSLVYQHGDGARRAFTYTGDSSTITGNVSTVDLSDADHSLHEDNGKIEFADLGIENRAGDKQAHKEQLLKWARGVDVLDENQDGSKEDVRNHMGDPMHSRPVILNYANSAGGSDTTIFVSTNEGFLHAIDRGGDSGGAHTSGGTELFSFIPKELLSNLDPYFENQAETSHPYGLDGALSVWTEDANKNVTIDGDERAFIYVGMRRGGNNYYALDVTDRKKPKLAWVIKGGTGGTPGFSELAQSWSRMVPSRIMLDGVEHNVLIFAGGYDVNQDPIKSQPNRLAPADGTGRAIYIVEAETGKLLYSAGGSALGGHDQQFTDMTHSIPGNIRVVDIDFDGLSDQMYVGDMTGQLWRFDIAKYHQSGDLLTGGVMAKLDGAGSTNDRRFYSEPDVAVISKDGERSLAISIGSGWRAHPLNEIVNDRFYMIRSDNVYLPPEKYGKVVSGVQTAIPLTEADLVDVTTDTDAPTNEHGWMLSLEKVGEKVLGPSITVNDQVIFTTYRPDPEVEDCSTAIGDGAVYAVSVLNGAPVLDLDDNGSTNANDRAKVLAHGGIPPDPAALITSSADGSIIKPIILVGPEQPLDVDFNNLTQRSFWMDREQKEEQKIEVSEDTGQ